MGVRVVAAVAALVLWGASGAAVAAYTETWNPPEASGHVAKAAKKNAVKRKAEAGAGSKATPKAASEVDSKHASSHVAMTTGHGTKPAPRGDVSKAAATTSPSKLAASHSNVHALSKNVSANSANSASDPATARSGALPPILH